MEKRNKKRITIISVYALLVLIAGTWIYSNNKSAPSCFDNIQNQDEEKVDCGGVCSKECPFSAEKILFSEESGFADGSTSEQFDLFAHVVNSNSLLGSGEFQYEFTIIDSQGNATAKKSGKSFILPGEKKYIIETDVRSSARPVKVTFEIKDTLWAEFGKYQEHPQLKVVNKKYAEINSLALFSEASGLLKNESPFEFKSIRIQIILKDESGKIIALNSTQINTVKSGENREFNAPWTRKFIGQVSNIEVQPEVNLFDELGI